MKNDFNSINRMLKFAPIPDLHKFVHITNRKEILRIKKFDAIKFIEKGWVYTSKKAYQYFTEQNYKIPDYGNKEI